MSKQLVLVQFWVMHTAGGKVCPARQQRLVQIVQDWCSIGCLWWQEACLHSSAAAAHAECRGLASKALCSIRANI